MHAPISSSCHISTCIHKSPSPYKQRNRWHRIKERVDLIKHACNSLRSRSSPSIGLVDWRRRIRSLGARSLAICECWARVRARAVRATTAGGGESNESRATWDIGIGAVAIHWDWIDGDGGHDHGWCIGCAALETDGLGGEGSDEGVTVVDGGVVAGWEGVGGCGDCLGDGYSGEGYSDCDGFAGAWASSVGAAGETGLDGRVAGLRVDGVDGDVTSVDGGGGEGGG
jgi:hypothetical protein